MMHKNRFITLEEELGLVKDYLELEHIRYEERLSFSLDIDPSTLYLQIPPMMIQTMNPYSPGMCVSFVGAYDVPNGTSCL